MVRETHLSVVHTSGRPFPRLRLGWIRGPTLPRSKSAVFCSNSCSELAARSGIRWHYEVARIGPRKFGWHPLARTGTTKDRVPPSARPSTPLFAGTRKLSSALGTSARMRSALGANLGAIPANNQAPRPWCAVRVPRVIVLNHVPHELIAQGFKNADIAATPRRHHPRPRKRARDEQSCLREPFRDRA